ncbi:ROK family protein [Streptomyces sp. NPDC101249]|uniref:ROK family protein n=1 Tax=Streptomyces sp. NPDC101249 TaxID=3366140 RepID=UPI00380A83E6
MSFSEQAPAPVGDRTGHLVGVDVGGTFTKAVLTDAGGTVLAEAHRPTPRPGPGVAERVVELAGRLTGELAARTPVPLAAAGLVVPGTVDERRGLAVHSENLGWRDVPFADLFARRTGLPVAFGHDVRAGGLAESRMGAAAGVRDTVVFLPVGTGIAAALLLDGTPYAAGGWAGEIGHVRVAPDEPCRCGLTGCLEAVASAAAVARRYRRRAGRPAEGAKEVAALVRAGDPVAVAVWEEAVEALAVAIRWLAAVLAPHTVVVGGGLASSGDLLLGPLERRVAEGLTFHRRPVLVGARLGDRAGALGAALLAAGAVTDGSAAGSTAADR